jgi:hypothetical protein
MDTVWEEGMKTIVGRLLIAAAIICLGLLIAPITHAQQSPSAVGSYAAGWNMVGGPPGTTFTGATAFYAYGPGGYITISAPTAGSSCQGYWAKFPTATTIRLPLSIGPIQDCPVAAGWNLLGNPFSGPAALPPDLTAYYWNPAKNAYDVVTIIPTGGAVWIYEAAPTTVELTYAARGGNITPTIDIINFFNSGPITVHVGDTIRLRVSINTPYTATADPAYLHLDSAGTLGDFTCLNDPSCTPVTTYNQFWLWTAVRAGTTTIVATPRCPAGNVPCVNPEEAIQVTILP